MQTMRDSIFEMNATKQIALQRVHTLFRLAREIIHEDPLDYLYFRSNIFIMVSSYLDLE